MYHYENIYRIGRGTQVYQPSYFACVEPKEHPLQAMLNAHERDYQNKARLRILNFVQKQELPFINKLIRFDIQLDHKRFDNWGNGWINFLTTL